MANNNTKQKIAHLERELKLKDLQLQEAQKSVKENERRVEDLLDLIQRERRQIGEKELILKEKEQTLQEYKRLKQLISVEKYESSMNMKEEEKKKECQNRKCLENSIELVNLRRKFDEMKKDFERQKMEKKNLETINAGLIRDLQAKDRESLLKKI